MIFTFVFKCTYVLKSYNLLYDYLFVITRMAITLTKNKKCAKYDSLRPIVLNSTFLYADNGSTLRLSYSVANKHSKQAMFAGFAGDVRTLLPGKGTQPMKLNHSYHLLSLLWREFLITLNESSSINVLINNYFFGKNNPWNTNLNLVIK